MKVIPLHTCVLMAGMWMATLPVFAAPFNVATNMEATTPYSITSVQTSGEHDPNGTTHFEHTFSSEDSDIDISANRPQGDSLALIFVEFDERFVTDDVLNASEGFLGLNRYNLGVIEAFGGVWEVLCLSTCTVLYDIVADLAWGDVLMQGTTGRGDPFTSYNVASGGISTEPFFSTEISDLAPTALYRDRPPTTSVWEPSSISLVAVALAACVVGVRTKQRRRPI